MVVRRPTKLHVGYACIKVRVSKEMEEEHGSYSGLKKVITLAEDSSFGIEGVNTLLHELLHAIYLFGSLQNSELTSDQQKADEERTVTVLANHLTDALRRNPQLLAWIQAELKPGGEK